MNQLFNGIPLPALPAWDSNVYYGVHIEQEGETYRLRLSTVPFVKAKQAWGSGSRDCLFALPVEDYPSYSVYSYTATENGWVAESYLNPQFVDNSNSPPWHIITDGTFSSPVIWASYDIKDYDTDGVYLAASEPVPVSTYTPNPAAMLMGFQLGTAIRRMRGMKQIEPEQPEQPEEEKMLVGYRYGDSPTLPDINSVWTDKETLAYASILYYATDNTYIVIFTPLPLYYYEGGCLVSENMTVTAGEFDGTAWAVQSLTMPAATLADHQFVWASYDIDNYSFATGGSDGTTHLAASDPVPVYA